MDEGKGLVISGIIAAVATVVAAVIVTSCSGSNGKSDGPSIDQRGEINVVCGDDADCGNGLR
ncbi:hypothetical protein [Streptomyces sp. NPDC048606]|uniref:hypothetical protein n=1 Tax=Streptomyces sp. NPDC048606 TaxID=3154726 RepID=UPI00342EEE6F